MAPTSVFVEVVHVTSRQRQQEVLRLFRRVAKLTAIEVSSDKHYFVIFWCADEFTKNAAEVILGDIEHDVVRTSFSGPPLRQMTPS
jgi:hypothetical protein